MSFLTLVRRFSLSANQSVIYLNNWAMDHNKSMKIIKSQISILLLLFALPDNYSVVVVEAEILLDF